MRKIKVLFASLITGIFGLTSCNFDLGFVKVGDSNAQIIKEDFEENPEVTNQTENNNEQSEENGNEASKEDDTFSLSNFSLEEMKNIIAKLAAEYYECDESELEFADYEDDSEDACYADIKWFDTSDLKFVLFSSWDFDFNAVGLMDFFIDLLPEKAELDNSISKIIDDEDGLYYDYFYKVGIYYIDFFILDDSEDDDYFLMFSMYIFPQLQYEAFDTYFAD